MNLACEKWRSALLEATLNGSADAALAEHLYGCSGCSEEWRALQARAKRLQGSLPMIAQGVEPSPDFRARVLAAAEARPKNRVGARLRMWALAGATAIVVLLTVSLSRHDRANRRFEEQLAVAQRLADWRAPSDPLLATPGRDMLRTVPTLGKSFLTVPAKSDREE